MFNALLGILPSNYHDINAKRLLYSVLGWDNIIITKLTLLFWPQYYYLWFVCKVDILTSSCCRGHYKRISRLLPGVMMRERPETEADLGTFPAEDLGFSGVSSWWAMRRDAPRRKEGLVPVLLLRSRMRRKLETIPSRMRRYPECEL